MSFLNIGNTCYLASALQCLFASKHFVSNIHTYLKQTDPFVKSLLHIYEQWASDKANIDPSEFYTMFKTHYTFFDNNREHDAHEALQVLIDVLSTKCSRMVHSTYDTRSPKEAYRKWLSKPINLMDETFQLQLESVIRCKKCNHQVITYQCEYGLFEKWVCTDVLLSDYKCDNCQQTNTCLQSVRVHHLPPCLILKSTSCNHIQLQIHNKRYRLVAVCKHYANPFKSGGHYVAVVRKSNEDAWYVKDDGKISLFVKGVEHLCDDGCFFVFEI